MANNIPDLDPEWIRELEENAKRMSLDQSALIKKLIIDGLKQLRVKKFLPLYVSGELSIGELAEKLDLTIYEVLLLLKVEKIPIGGDLEQTQDEIKFLESRIKQND